MDAVTARRRRRIELALEGAETLTPLALLGRVVGALAETLDLSGACWHLTDPSSGIPIVSSRVGAPPGDFEQSLEFEFRRQDVMRYSDLARPRGGSAVLSLETGGRPRTSPRFREMIEPAGGADELRASFTDAFGTWATMGLYSTSRFIPEDAALVAGLVPAITSGVRRARSREASEPLAEPGSSVVVLDGADRVQAADARARERMADLATPGGTGLPNAFYVLAAQARARDPERPAHAHALARGGSWFALDASPLDDERHRPVAIVLRPAPREGVLDALLRAYGLSAREREVAALTVQGWSARAIAQELVLSRYTVQDHLKHIYEKTSVRTRGELCVLATGSKTGTRR